MEMDNQPLQCTCRYKHTPRTEETKRQLENRLNRMIGQLNGIKIWLRITDTAATFSRR